jgi:hypothetical protein
VLQSYHGHGYSFGRSDALAEKEETENNRSAGRRGISSLFFSVSYGVAYSIFEDQYGRHFGML